MVAISQFGNYFIKFSTFSYLCLEAFDRFPLKLPRYLSDMIMLIEIVRHVIQVTMLSGSLNKKGYEFPMKVGSYSCESKCNAKNMLKAFEIKYKLEAYEVMRLGFYLNGYTRVVLRIGSVIKHVKSIEDYWIDCKHELEIWNRAFVRLKWKSENIWYWSDNGRIGGWW